MAAAAGIWNHSTATGNLLAGVNPMDSTSSGSSTSTSNSSTISANDFLTLLVTEMQHQDPTATTDPNQYINQLVQVNSLEQLININQTLTKDSTGTTTGSSVKPALDQSIGSTPDPSGGTAATTAQSSATSRHGSTASAAECVISRAAQALHPTGAAIVNGNLSVPAGNPAAHRVAQALGGRTPIG